MLEARDQVEGLWVAGCECSFEGRFGRSIGSGVERFTTGLGFGAKDVELDVAENGGFNSRKRKKEARVKVSDRGSFGGFGPWRFAGKVEFGFDLREGKGDGHGVAVLGEGVDPGASGVAKAEKLGDFVVGFAGGVVYRAADEGVVPGAVGGTGEIEMRVSAGDDEGKGGFVGGLVSWEGFAVR